MRITIHHHHHHRSPYHPLANVFFAPIYLQRHRHLKYQFNIHIQNHNNVLNAPSDSFRWGGFGALVSTFLSTDPRRIAVNISTFGPPGSCFTGAGSSLEARSFFPCVMLANKLLRASSLLPNGLGGRATGGSSVRGGGGIVGRGG